MLWASFPIPKPSWISLWITWERSAHMIACFKYGTEKFFSYKHWMRQSLLSTISPKNFVLFSIWGGRLFICILSAWLGTNFFIRDHHGKGLCAIERMFSTQGWYLLWNAVTYPPSTLHPYMYDVILGSVFCDGSRLRQRWLPFMQ